jgi:4-amino-4-deoxy-L-arabinose transferase-like glycosyltransferase
MPYKTENSGIDQDNRVYWLDLLLVAVFCAAFFGFRLGSYVPLSEDEGFVAVTARETLDGNWIVPHFNTQIHLQKFPLMYWMVAGVSAVFGQVNEWTVRLPSALASGGIALWLTFLSTRMFGRLTGVVTGLATVSSIGMLWFSHLGIPDMLMTFFITACFVFLYLSLEHIQEEKSPRLTLFFAYSALALAILAKTPVPIPVILLPTLGFLVWLSLAGRWERIDRSSPSKRLTSTLVLTAKGLGFYLKRLHLFMGLIILILIVGSWILGVVLSVPDAIERRHEEYLARYLDYLGTSEPFLYDVPQIFLLTLPWSVFLPLGLTLPFRKIFKDRRFELMFIFFWLVGGFLFFSLPSDKSPYQILPILPPAIVLSAAGMVFALEHWLKRKSVFIIYTIIITVTLLALGIGYHYIDTHYSHLVDQYRVIAAVLIFAQFVSLFAYIRIHLLASVTAIALAVGVCFAVVWSVIPRVTDPNRDPRVAAKLIRNAIDTDSPLYSIGPAYPPLVFYLDRTIPQIPSDQQITKTFSMDNAGKKGDLTELELLNVIELLGQSERVYLITSDDRYQVVQSDARRHKSIFYETLRINKFYSEDKGLVIFSNRPAPATSPRTTK